MAAGASKTHVFISYSRKNRDFVVRLADALKARGIEVHRDLDDILPTEEWKQRIEKLIGGNDTIVFVISKASIDSPVCQWELGLCEKLNKRLAPIVIEETHGYKIPETLSKLNYIFFTERDD